MKIEGGKGGKGLSALKKLFCGFPWVIPYLSNNLPKLAKTLYLYINSFTPKAKPIFHKTCKTNKKSVKKNRKILEDEIIHSYSSIELKRVHDYSLNITEKCTFL